MKDIILSIKPRFSSQIIQGHKPIELRKSITSKLQPGSRIAIYSSSPIQAINAVASVSKIECFHVNDRKQEMMTLGGITEEEYDAYYKGRTHGTALWLTGVTALEKSIELGVLRTLHFTPPQGFTYGTEAIWALIHKHLNTPPR